MGRDAGDLFPTREAAVHGRPHDVHRKAVPGAQGAHEEAGDPGRRDRGHVGRASELREAAGTGTAGREDPPRLSREDVAGDVCGLRRPIYRDGERDGPEPDGAKGPPSGGPRRRRPGGPERLHRGPRSRLLQRGHRTRPRRDHCEAHGRTIRPGEAKQRLDQDQEEDDPRLRNRRHHGGRGRARGRGTGRNQGTPMAKLQLTDVEIFVKDLKATRAFYTRKIGLKVRSAMPKWGYLALGATKGGEDAALTPWQPVPEWGQEMYESRLKMIGGVTGIGFMTNDRERTVPDLKKKGVKTAVDGESETFGRFTDPAGNVLFLAQPAKPKVRRAGVSALGVVTVASRDSKKTGEFFRQALGMRKQRAESEEEGFDSDQLSPKATAITPFTPRKDIYDNPADYDADMAHIGEETGIGFTTSDIYRLQEQLLAKGVRFKEKAEAQDWGGIRARFFDRDDNVYSLVEYKG